jgi:signal transduction histidine kinase
MDDDHSVGRPRLLRGGRDEEQVDSRVASVLEVLGGNAPAEVARRWSVDPALLHRWVQAFVEAGTAQVTNRPSPEAANQRDRFLTAFAHELRTPLAVAQGWVGMLLEGDVPTDAMDGTVRRLHDALGRLSERTLDVELLGAASLGRLRLAPRPVTVAELASGLPDLAGVDGEGPDVEIVVDPELFRRVLRDLWEAGTAQPAP